MRIVWSQKLNEYNGKRKRLRNLNNTVCKGYVYYNVNKVREMEFRANVHVITSEIAE